MKINFRTLVLAGLVALMSAAAAAPAHASIGGSNPRPPLGSGSGN